MNVIGKIGIAIGVLGGMFGLAVGIMAAPVMGSIMAIIFIGIFGGVWWAFIRPMSQSSKLLKTGIAAPGVITRIWDTGVTINNDPEIGLEVQVTPSTGMPFTAQAKKLISRLDTYSYQAGMACTVRYDPNNTSKVAIESIGGNAGNSGNAGYSQQQVQQAQDELMKQDNLNQQILSYGTSAKAVVLSYQDMNIKVNGNNPAVTLQVQVTPDDRPAFKAIVKGIVKETSVPRFQPGHEIYVKFDPNDITKVAVEHS